MRDVDGQVRKVSGHLIDCRAYKGFSGSPCFAQYESETDHGIDASTRWTVLLGIVAGHFEEVDSMPLSGDVSGREVVVPVHSGVGVVVPIRHVTELLNTPDLVAMRLHAEAK